MKRRTSIKTKISISVFLVSLVCSLLIGYFSYVNFKSNLQDYMGRRALDIAETTSININGDEIENYDKTDETDDNYSELIDYLSKIKKNVNLTYLYIVTDAGTDYKYIAEGSTGNDDPSELGDTQSKNDFEAEASKALSTGKGAYVSKFNYDEDVGEYLMSAYAPVFNSENKVVGLVGLDIGVDIINQSIAHYLPALFGLMILSCILSFILIYVIVTKLVVGPIQVLEAASLKLSCGKFDFQFPDSYLKKKDEIGNLSRSFHDVAANIKEITQDISFVLTEMANHNIAVEIKNNYQGDFLPIKDSINQIIESYNEMLTNFSYVAEQVSSSSMEVSEIAGALAQGSTEQSSAIDELTESVKNVSMSADKNTENVNVATNYVSDMDNEVRLSDTYMNQMLEAMNNISATSHKISEVMKVINDITFQTNILALNANIEAARAGEAGKGFSVVAEQVRSLAKRTQEAALQTSDLIDRSIDAANNGENIADKTAKALRDVDLKAQIVYDTINKITVASKGQAAAIAEIKQELNQISEVVQNNAAKAEESAAASEELSNHAATLHAEIAKFHLKEK